MAFSPVAPPKRAGDYTRFVTRRASTLPPSTGGVVAIPFLDASGPVGEPVLLESFDEYINVFGAPVDPDTPSQGFIAVYNAFKGEDSDHPGAGAVLAYRQAHAASVATADQDLAAGATPAALTIAARYPGTRGNEYKVEVIANASSPATQRDVRLYYQSLLLHTFKGVASTGIVDLVADINRVASKDFVASGGVNGTVLDAVAPTALAGGNDGTALDASDWTTTREALEPHAFGYFAPANLTDVGILASLQQWVADLNAAQKSKRFYLVEGGAASEDFTTASDRSADSNNENVINVGVGLYRDNRLGIDLSTAALAPRIAGVAAARGGGASLSFAYLEDLELLEGPQEDEILAAFDQGVVVLGRATGGVRIERGVTTYTTTTDNEKPFEVYSKIKYVTTMHSIERGMRERNEQARILGILPVNDDTREYLVGREQGELDKFVEAKELQSGAKVLLSPGEQSDDDEHIPIDWTGKFSRSLEQIRRTVYLS